MTYDQTATAIMEWLSEGLMPDDPEYPFWPLENHDVRRTLVAILARADAERAEAEPQWSPV